MPLKTCLFCNKEYSPVRVWQKYCSYYCSHFATKELRAKYAKEHYRANVEKYRIAGLNYIKRNRKKILERKKQIRWEKNGPPNPKKTEEEKRAYRKKWNHDNRELISTKNWARDLIKDYGITVQQYNDLKEKQHSKCAICYVPQTELISRLAVDHCHKSGIVRGLLCKWCNQTLGLFKDDPDRFLRAAEYLKAINVCT